MEENNYLSSVITQFRYYKSLADKAMSQLSDQQLFFKPGSEVNSIANIAKHMCGNMLSRWTDFLSTDGEKPWRKRDAEFEDDHDDYAEVLKKWKDGWNCLFKAMEPLGKKDLTKAVYIRGEAHSVVEAINRQVAHYAYHVGQIVFISKLLCESEWQPLTIPKGLSEDYNAEKFTQKDL